jgi:hypothetical protein
MGCRLNMVVRSTKATYMIDFWMSPQKIINSAYHKIPLSKKNMGFFSRRYLKVNHLERMFVI